MATLGGWLKRIPLGVWAALGASLVLIDLYLRGRRLEAELAQAKLHKVAAQARAGVARNEGRASVHREQVRKAEERIEEIETARALASSSGVEDEKRLSALSPDMVHQEYMKLLVKKRAELNMEQSLKTSGSLGRITIRSKRPLIVDEDEEGP